MKKTFFLCAFLAISLFFCLPATADVIINEVMASNGTYINGNAFDWLELYNNGSKAVDLSGWYLSNKEGNPTKWSFPQGARIKAGGYVLVYCTGDNAITPGSGSTFYTTFKISASGATLVLTQPDGVNTEALLVLPAQYGNIAYGLPNGQSEYMFLESDTPGKENCKSGFLTRAESPVITTAGGYYSDNVTVFANAASENDVLRYTLDGSTPTSNSPIMSSNGVTLNKTAVFRVRTYHERMLCSPVVSTTYFINDENTSAVVSLITDDKYLFSNATGALVKGNGSTANYEKNWEYPVNIEYYNESGECEINQMGTFRVSGHSARINAQKSIAIYARKAFGEALFSFNPFPNRDYSEYKSLLLRSANSDAYSTRLRDVFISSLSEGLGLLYQDARVIVVYINGEYWGHYNLREQINKYFVAQYEGITDEDEIDSIDILKRTGSDNYIENGNNDDWVALCDYCKTTDLNDPQALAWVESQIDINSLFTHAAFEMLVGNYDFTNVRVYRVPGGKWKYLLFDVEAGFMGVQNEPINYYIKPVTGKIQGFRHEPLNALLNVPEMKARFLTRFAEIIETNFLWPQVSQKLEYCKAQLLPLLERHIARWRNLKMSDWYDNVNAVAYYARVRPGKVITMLAKAMKLTDEEVELYFGHVKELLDTNNILK